MTPHPNPLQVIREALERNRRQMTIARCTLERKIQASDYVRDGRETDPADYAQAALICADIREFITLAHGWVEKAENGSINALTLLDEMMREPDAIEQALQNAAKILANFKTEGNRTKQEEWEAAFAMLFKQMNDLVVARGKEPLNWPIMIASKWKTKVFPITNALQRFALKHLGMVIMSDNAQCAANGDGLIASSGAPDTEIESSK